MRLWFAHDHHDSNSQCAGCAASSAQIACGAGGMSLSDYLLSEIRHVAERPTLEELRARLKGRPATTPSMTPAQAVRAERDRQ
jgi:hypothetical protein